MKLHFIKTPDGDLVNLAHIFYIDVINHTNPKWDHVLYANCSESDYSPKEERNFFPAKALAWGSKEYCESIKDKIEKLLEDHHILTIIEGENTLLEIEEEVEEEPDKEPDKHLIEPDIGWTHNTDPDSKDLNDYFDEIWGN